MDLSWWLTVKTAIVATTGLERDALHIYAGVATQLLTVAVLRRDLREWRALLPLLAGELVNEGLDLAYDLWPPDARMAQYGASIHDILNTLAMPVVILLIARRLVPRGSERDA